MLNPYYVSGFADGEGSFSITISPNVKFNIGWQITPSFSLSQNKNSRAILFKIKNFFGCGSIRPSRKDNTYKYEVRSIKDLKEKIIPHFEKYSLHTAKRKDFNIFKEVVRLMHNNEHLNKEGLKTIFSLLEEMNPNSKKIYDRKRLMREISEGIV
ncbi:MAG TPA: endonuclease [Candidatus Omnitrophica bacterium]|nr:endonuclease [Candidatus Omnitrophota bacterium]